MSLAEANWSLPDHFTGIVKLFPLPDLVLFPGVIQPLHIFEMRYRRMLQDALAGDELIAVTMLKPNWEASGAEAPPVFSTICIGKIIQHARLDDGRFNLLLLGTKRAKIVRELSTELPYRLAEVELIEDHAEANPSFYRGPIRKHVIKLFRELVDNDEQLDCESVENLLCDDLPFGLLLDLIAFSSAADLHLQQSILESDDVLTRANKVIEIIEQKLRPQTVPSLSAFLPAFSQN